MGNTQSSQDSKKKSLGQIVDYVATNYILTQNFQDMKNLSDLKYCDNLVILTSNIIANHLSDLDVEFLAQRTKSGVEVNEMTKQKVLYLNKDDLTNLDVRNKIQKKRLCIGIAKFYIKIAHLFAAVVTTINPIYTWKGAAGDKQKVDLMHKQDIPKDAKVSTERINLCSERINALINNQDFNVSNGGVITVKPKFCSINLNSDNTTKTLFEEPGIPELQFLYYDKYNYSEGGYTGMSGKMAKTYEDDVKKFYTIFTGNKKVPDAIKTFGDIKLKDFHRGEGCKGFDVKTAAQPGVPQVSKGPYTKAYTGSLKEKLFSDYANHVKQMTQTATTNQDALLRVIDQLFVFNVNPQTLKKEVVINPKLDETNLQTIVENTRNLIIKLYLTCEQDFLKGLEIFEGIVEKQIMDTSKEQIQDLEETIEQVVA